MERHHADVVGLRRLTPQIVSVTIQLKKNIVMNVQSNEINKNQLYVVAIKLSN